MIQPKMSRSFLKLLITIFLVNCLQAQPQFWKMNALSAKDMFIMDVRSTMSAGICYKQVQAKASDPELRIRTVSFCCTGYQRSPLSPHKVKCDAVCNEDCSNGICSAPDVCECFPSFERKGGRCESIYQ